MEIDYIYDSFSERYKECVAQVSDDIPELELFSAAHKLLEIDISEIMANVKAAGNSRPIACKEGCAYCCSGMQIQTIDIEVKAICDYVRAHWTDAQITALKDRVAIAYAKLKGKSQVEYVLLQVPCPFLRGKSCSIYEMRPLACVQFTSTSRNKCKQFPKSRDGTAKVQMSAVHQLSAQAMAGAIHERFGGTKAWFIDELYRQLCADKNEGE